MLVFCALVRIVSKLPANLHIFFHILATGRCFLDLCLAVVPFAASRFAKDGKRARKRPLNAT
jgi:hypothetical protein